MSKEKDTTNEYKVLNKKELEKNGMELEIEIPADVLESFRTEAVQEVSKDIELDGFRKGKVPEQMVVDKVGDMAIVEKMAYSAINSIYPIIVVKEKINALTTPEISITKIAPNSPLVFKAKITLIPEVTLPDYKKLVKEVKPIDTADVTEKEMDDYIKFLLSQRAQMMKLNSKEEEKEPELNDEFVKTLGDFKNVEEFKKVLKENMQKEKGMKEHQRRRGEIIEKIVAEAKIDVPDILIAEELDQMVGQFKHKIENMKMKPEDYFKEIKKTEEDLRKEWKTDAEKRVKMNLILPKIAGEEKLDVDQKQVDDEVAKLGEHMKEHGEKVDPVRAKIYVTNVLLNEEVFKFLESIK